MFYQQIENGNIANQIHGLTIDYGKFILIQNMISGLSGNKSVLSLTCAVCVTVESVGRRLTYLLLVFYLSKQLIA